jgi:hypothetical protein
MNFRELVYNTLFWIVLIFALVFLARAIFSGS